MYCKGSIINPHIIYATIPGTIAIRISAYADTDIVICTYPAPSTTFYSGSNFLSILVDSHHRTIIGNHRMKPFTYSNVP